MNATLAIAAVTVGFICYQFITQSPQFCEFFENRWGGNKAKAYQIYGQLWLGAFLYGVLPAIIALSQGIDFQDIGIRFQHGGTTMAWWLGLGLVIVAITYFSHRKPDSLAMYPAIRVPPPWSRRMTFASALSWVGYLLAYEFLFRGFLLFTCLEEMGVLPAIAINTSLYALVHVQKGWKETIGAIPLGIVFCLLAIQTGTIWIPFLVHVTMSLSNEWWTLRYLGRVGN
ncbi:MAG: CPBP family intramembrane metalloprotease [Lewinellaceae bacterium]|nr:CPBP family intramembrane metalloprotease [Saprospiraceae bacterium]MCB9340583.1 CPBP family intramembrane metalloprotease [Lewinellaceae bacterium]